jgi:hypothetical protein
MNQPLLTPADEVRLYSEAEICEALHIPRPRFRVLRRRRLIPFVKLGYRSYLYDIIDVRRALDRLKIKAVS